MLHCEVRGGMVSQSRLQRPAARLQGLQHPDNVQSGNFSEIKSNCTLYHTKLNLNNTTKHIITY